MPHFKWYMIEKKVFTSLDEVKKDYFPKNYAMEQQDKQIKEQGFGKYIARQIIKGISKELSK